MGVGEEEGVESGKRWVMEFVGLCGEMEYGVMLWCYGLWFVLDCGYGMVW